MLFRSDCDWKSTTVALPLVVPLFVSVGLNEHTITLLPEFELQAKFLLVIAPSP